MPARRERRDSLTFERWDRFDTDFREFWYNYHRESIVVDGQVYTSVNGWGPAGHVGVIVTYNAGQAQRHPLSAWDTAFVTAWAVDDHGRLITGTTCARDGFEQTTSTPVFVFDNETWPQLGTAPTGVRDLVVV